MTISLFEFDDTKIELLKQTVCKKATDAELNLFLHVCKHTGLDPFMKQIYSIARGGQRTIQTSIDGLRLIADRTKKYAPGKESIYSYDKDGKLLSATSYIKKLTEDGQWHEVSATCFFSEYNPGNNQMWKKMPHVMLAKCAEACALRKAFPAEMSGLYSDDEMKQAKDSDIVDVDVVDPEAEETMKCFHEVFLNEDMYEYLKEVSSMSKKPEHTIAAQALNNKDGFISAFESWVSKKEKDKPTSMDEVIES